MRFGILGTESEEKRKEERAKSKGAPVKFAPLLFFEKFNWAPITGFPLRSNKQVSPKNRDPPKADKSTLRFDRQRLG